MAFDYVAVFFLSYPHYLLPYDEVHITHSVENRNTEYWDLAFMELYYNADTTFCPSV